jgi:TP901-1 family phage major tail protein
MINGTNVLLLANTGTDSAPVYAPVGSQRDATIDENTEAIDYSSKDARERRVGPGRYTSSISMDALYVPNNNAYTALKNAMRNGTLIKIAIEESEAVTETADAVISTMSSSYPDQGEATISISLDIDGAWLAAGS